ncbi:MAG: hypothetical protein EBV06_06320 [Planctomycetia bacterium]|nr:hypothetical protein [Planctomycetia bacterium]
MNEHDWFFCREPTPMIQFLVQRSTNERKLRLLACACCRQVWHLLSDPHSRRAVETAERYADGMASSLELARARAEALNAAGSGERQAAWAAYWAANTKAGGPLWNSFAAAAGALVRQNTASVGYNHAAVWDAQQVVGNRDQVALIHEIIGNPFHPPQPRCEWLTWANGTIPAMAKAIHHDRAFEQMPILADALEEAGCDDSLWLNHCREPQTHHVPGCWLLDALAGWS